LPVPPSTTRPGEPQLLLYRAGSNTSTNFTPRPIKDTLGWPNNGLSTYVTKSRACTGDASKVQVLDAAALAAVPHLRLVPDPADPQHVFLSADSADLLDSWAASRATAETSPFSLTTAVAATRLRQEACT
jgi:hypothetical protein